MHLALANGIADRLGMTMHEKFFRKYWPVLTVGSSLIVVFYFIASPYQNCKRIFTQIAQQNNYTAMSAEHREICKRQAGWGG